MARIRVTRGGCGIEYADEHGNKRHALKTFESGPFECDDTQAARLIRLGVAEYIVTAEKSKEPEQHQEAPKESGKITGHLSAEDLESMTYDELKKLAADMGVEVKGKKKADYIAAIAAVEVEAGDEDDGDELPDLDAADPE